MWREVQVWREVLAQVRRVEEVGWRRSRRREVGEQRERESEKEAESEQDWRACPWERGRDCRRE